MKPSPRIIAHSALLLVAMIYGLNYTVAKDVMPEYLQPRGFIFTRAFGATILFWLVAAIFKWERIHKKDIPRLVICGFFGVAANQLMFFEGLNLTTPISASIMMTVNPVLVLVLASIILREKLTGRKIGGIILGIIGAILLITRGGQQLEIIDSDKSLGNLLVLLNAASYAAYLVLVKPLMGRYSAITVIRWVFFFGLLIVLPFGFNQFTAIDWQELPEIIIWEVAFVVVFTTFIAYLLNVYALKTVSSTTVGFYVYLQPLFAGIVAISLGKDHLTGVLLLSATLIFIGVYMVSGKKQNRNV